MTSQCRETVCSFSALLLAAGLAAQTIAPPAEFEETRRLLQRAVGDGELPGASVVVLRAGEIVWAEGFGFADLATQRPATPDTVYPVGRISEVLTATGLMLLADREVIDLDKPVNDYLPGAKLRFPSGDPDTLTVEAVMQHGAGLPGHWNAFEAEEMVPSLEQTLRDYGITAGFRNLRVTHNVGYVALARVIEAATDQPWDRFLRQDLFSQLRMHATGPLASTADVATIYRKDTTGSLAPVAPLASDNPAANGLWSSASDLAHFVLLYLQGGGFDGKRIMRVRQMRRMRTELRRKDHLLGRVDSEQHIGWRPWPEPEYFFFTGSASTAGGRIRGYPRQDDGYVLLTNGPESVLLDAESQLIVDMGLEMADANMAVGYGVDDAPPIEGAFEGTVQLPRDTLEVGLQIGEGHAILSVGGETVPSTESRIRSSTFRASFAPDHHLPGTQFRAVPTWRFDLRLTGDTLTGIAYAEAEGRFRLAHLVELRPDR